MGWGGLDESPFCEENAADTDTEAVNWMSQEELPLQTPLHPWKVLPDSWVAASETIVPDGKDAEQVPVEHLKPAGELVTIPLPLPVIDNWIDWRGLEVWIEEKVAEAETEDVKFTTQFPVPEQDPDQPLKLLPVAGDGIKVREVPWVKMPEQVPAEQVNPDGALVTVPSPWRDTVIGKVTGVIFSVMVFDTSGAGKLSFPEVS